VEQENNQTQPETSEKGILRRFTPLEEKKGGWKEVFLPAAIILIIILAGAGTGYLLNRF